MQINLPTVAAPASSLTLTAARASPGWQLGQVLTAEVIGTSATHDTRLRIGGQEVAARSELPLQPGQRLQLEVTASAPQVVLRVRNGVPPQQAAIARGLAHSLPRQGSLGDTLALLRRLDGVARGQAGTASTAPAGTALRDVASHLLSRLPHSTTLAAPAQLRAAVMDAAMPAEARILQTRESNSAPSGLDTALGRLARVLATPASIPTPGPPGQSATASAMAAGTSPGAPAQTVAPRGEDLPAAHARPPGHDARHIPAPAPDAEQLPSTPTTLATAERDGLGRLVDGALARLQTHHLGNAMPMTGAPWHFAVELPVRHGDRVDVWQLEFDGEAPARDSDETLAPVQVTVRLLLDHDVEFRARLDATPAGLGIRVDSSDARLSAALAERLADLETALAHRAVPLARLGMGSVAVAERPTTLPCRLIDVAV